MDISNFQLDSVIGHRTENPYVGGSIPSLATNRINHLLMADTNSCRPLPQMMPQTVFGAIDSRLSSPADNPLRPPIPDDNPGHYFALPCFVVRFVGHGSISHARWDRRSRRVSSVHSENFVSQDFHKFTVMG